MPYLCFDLGSSSVKAAVISEDGGLLGLGRSPTAIIHGSDGSHESDPGSWIEAALGSAREALARARACASSGSAEIRAIAVSGNGPTLLAADAEGRPIRPALSWMDRRASAEAEEVSREAGFRIDPGFYLPKALMLWRRYDEVKSRAKSFFSCPEYLAYKLCGEARSCLPAPGYEPYIWDETSAVSLGLPPALFPPFARPATMIGALTPLAAEGLGLESGIPVVMSYPDFLAAILGSASVEPGLACDRSGTSEALNVCAARPFPDARLLSLPHPIEGLWNLSGGLSSSGAALAWVDGMIGGGTTELGGRSPPDGCEGDSPAASRLSRLASSSPRGSRGLVFLPYFAGERAPLWDSSRRAAFVGLSLEHGSADIARAACESIAFGLRLAADIARSGGFPLELVRVTGFAGRDDFLCSLKADILGLPVEAPELPEAELLGDAAACAVALGDRDGLLESSRSLYRARRRFEPSDPGGYEGPYSDFRAALSALGSFDAERAHGASS